MDETKEAMVQLVSELTTSASPRQAPTGEAPWLQGLRALTPAYPAISELLKRLFTVNQTAIRVVYEEYEKRLNRMPGRCALLLFHEEQVEKIIFDSPSELSDYIQRLRNDDDGQCRLWLLEDLAPQ